MINTLKVLYNKLLNQGEKVYLPIQRPELLAPLGKSTQERTNNLLKRILSYEYHRENRHEIFTYIVTFWEQALVSLPYKKGEYRGLNLARRPFLAPSIPSYESSYGFYEQYRWDTYFHNKGLLLAGCHDIAINQILNFVDVYDEFHRIPNALTSAFLSHAQPPLEAFAMEDLLEHTDISQLKIKRIVDMIESELVTEWLDYGRLKRYLRQTKDMHDSYGMLSRYTDMHLHPLLAGCEDGKDHNWLTITYGSQYLPVQLNAILYGILSFLTRYYKSKDHGNNHTKATRYEEMKTLFYQNFQRVFWHEGDKWQGFKNYSLRPHDKGPILYGDLSAEIWPLFVGLATVEQAEITKQNIMKYYKGDYGLAATSLELREGGSIPTEPAGFTSFQWEYPNCWAPLMYIACEGLKKYGYIKEVSELQKNWIFYIEKTFVETKHIPEKGPYQSGMPTNEGLYGLLFGFGWTISVYLAFLKDLSKQEEL